MSWRDVKKAHPSCDVWPERSQEGLRALAADIAANGMQAMIHEALYGGEWVIIDGKTRLDAHDLLGIELFDAKGEWKHPERVKKHWVKEEQIPATIEGDRLTITTEGTQMVLLRED